MQLSNFSNRLFNIMFFLFFVFHSLGSSLNITYMNLNPGRYILRIVANAGAGERDLLRRVIRIGKYCTSNTGLPDVFISVVTLT